MSKEQNTKIAVILVRGRIDLDQGMLSTLDMLKLQRKNYCVIIKDTPVMRGMIQKVKDYVTFGTIDEETYKLLVDKKGEEYKGRTQDTKGKIDYSSRYIEVNGKKLKPYFRLNPPKKGFGRKGIKKPFKLGGALGDRKEKINDLIQRML